MTEHAKQILDLLVTKTTSKEITWQKASGTNQYKMQFQNGAAITISYSYAANTTGGSTSTVYYIIYNEKGSVVEKNNVTKSNPDYQKLKDLYDLIGRIDRKEDETFSSIINELKSKGNQSAGN